MLQMLDLGKSGVGQKCVKKGLCHRLEQNERKKEVKSILSAVSQSDFWLKEDCGVIISVLGVWPNQKTNQKGRRNFNEKTWW